MEASIAWKESTQKIFWGVIVIAVAGIFSVLYDYVSYGVSIFEFVAQYLPANNSSGLDAFFTSIHTLGFLAKLSVVIGYVLYLMGLTRFAAMQTNTAAALNIQKVRTAVIILICCFAASAVFGILFSIPFLGTLLSLAVWVATLVAYFKMRNAFGVLTASPAFSPASQKGARKLRYAALCNIRLMLMPIVVALIIGVLALMAVAVLKGGSDPTGFLYIGGIVGAATIVGALVFMFFALVYPFIGWYQIMNGGPGEDTLTDAAEIEQRMTAISTTEEQVQALKEKGLQAYATAKEALAPRLEKARAWCVAHQKQLGIGAGCVVIVSLISWIVSWIGGNKGIAFETYEVMDNIEVTIDIPQGNSEREQNVTKGLREIIASSEMCGRDVIGAPIEGTIQEIIADCNRRYQTFADNFMRRSDAPAPPVCQLFIESVYQNKACAVFQVDDGVYFNGSPDTYFRIIRFADGRVMKQGEMVFISKEEVEALAKKYNDEENGLPVYLDDGYSILPAANDSCRITWAMGHGYGEAMVPLSEIESRLTDEGKEIFTAKALTVPEKKVPDAAAAAEEQADTEPAAEVESKQELSGLIGLLPEGTTEYTGEMAGFPVEFSITKSADGVSAVYRNVKFGATIQLESDAQVDHEGNTTFWGNDAQGNQWRFHLGGNENYLFGYAVGDGKNLQVELNKK